VRLDNWIRQIAPDLIVYEEVTMPHKSTRAAQVYGGLVATVTTYCDREGIPCEALHVEAIKRHATGRGKHSNPKATKNVVFWAAQDKFDPTHQYLSDERKHNDQADALWILDCYLHGEYSPVKVTPDGEEAA